MYYVPNTEKCSDPLCPNVPDHWYIMGYCSEACYQVAIKKARESWQMSQTDPYSLRWHRQWG